MNELILLFIFLQFVGPVIAVGQSVLNMILD